MLHLPLMVISVVISFSLVRDIMIHTGKEEEKRIGEDSWEEIRGLGRGVVKRRVGIVRGKEV